MNVLKERTLGVELSDVQCRARLTGLKTKYGMELMNGSRTIANTARGMNPAKLAYQLRLSPCFRSLTQKSRFPPQQPDSAHS